MDLWDSKPSEFSIINIKMQEQVDILINDKLPFPYVSLINKLLFHAAIFYGKIKGSAVVLLRNIENFQSCFPFCLSQCLHWIIRFTSVVISFEKAGVDVKVGQNLLLCYVLLRQFSSNGSMICQKNLILGHLYKKEICLLSPYELTKRYLTQSDLFSYFIWVT